jgi:hypothetical protein
MTDLSPWGGRKPPLALAFQGDQEAALVRSLLRRHSRTSADPVSLVAAEALLARLEAARPLETPAALALRALQKYDQAVPVAQQSGPPDRAVLVSRPLLLEAQSELGKLLGLRCAGVAEGNGWFSHNGETCPVHEWLVAEDHDAVQAAVS